MTSLELNIREEIKEFLILNQPYIKKHVLDMKRYKEALLEKEMPIFRNEIGMQYDVRINQWISFLAAKELGIAVEYVIIELENIDVDKYLKV